MRVSCVHVFFNPTQDAEVKTKIMAKWFRVAGPRNSTVRVILRIRTKRNAGNKRVLF